MDAAARLFIAHRTWPPYAPSLTSSYVEVVPSAQIPCKVMLSMATNEQGVSSQPLWSLRLMGRFALLSVGVWLYAADTLVTATISPGMIFEIGGIDYVNWAVSLYEVGAIIAGAAAGMLCSRFGIKRVLSVAGALYAFGCAVAAMAPSMTIVVIGRLVQGLGGGMLLSLCYFAMYEWFRRNTGTAFSESRRLLGRWLITRTFWSGIFVNHYSWRGAFWLFVCRRPF